MTSTLTESTNRGRAVVPGHITGLFRIYDMHEDPLYRGSLGAGFSITSGTKTEVRITSSKDPEITVSYNDRPIDAPVTRAVIELMSKEIGKTFKAMVRHESELIIGVGFGASGAGALGTAIAMNRALADHFDPIRVAQFAHVAEVINRTGLGDVIAQVSGGVEVRTRPGAPGIGSIKNIASPSLQVVLAGSPGLETSQVLSDPINRKMINEAGDRIIAQLISEPTFENFINYSREFAKHIGLMTKRIDAALTDLDKNGLTNSSMVMLGDSVFCFCRSNEVDRARAILKQYWRPDEIMITSIERDGGRAI